MSPDATLQAIALGMAAVALGLSLGSTLLPQRGPRGPRGFQGPRGEPGQQPGAIAPASTVIAGQPDMSEKSANNERGTT